MKEFFDVVVMGGGPAGASLASRLARDSNLRVGLFEAERFPREHIGESFASPVVPCLQECGALPAVLSSDCWVKKFGGYYSWDHQSPAVAFFRHRLWEMDGVHRWSIHVNRSEFDTILLRHAAGSGVKVHEGLGVEGVDFGPERTTVRLANGDRSECSIFVNASGRANAVRELPKKGWLSSYRNIAIWTHCIGGKLAQSLAGDWNIFRDRDLSPIGCFAFEHGWCWYIPVPQTIGGRRILTHSIGIVTDPKLLKQPGPSLTSMDGFLDTLRKVPLLGDLIRDVRPVYQHLHTATNYSMIAPRMCDHDERWIAVGDSSFFVDPLFSSGVSFAMLQAAAAAQLVKSVFDRRFTEQNRRELWHDYDDLWKVTAQAFATNIDQWYAAIARESPGSVYWQERVSESAHENRSTNFDWLLDTDLSSDLLQVMTKGTGQINSLAAEGALVRAFAKVSGMDPAGEAVARFRGDVAIRSSLSLRSSAFGVAESASRPSVWAHGAYWSDPDAHASEVASLFPEPERCYRFYSPREPDAPEVKFFSERTGFSLERTLRGQGATFARLREELSAGAWSLLMRLVVAGIVVGEPTRNGEIHS